MPKDVTMSATIHPQLEEIARRTLRVETLETRNSDHLDFHEASVREIHDALQAAYEAGRDSAIR